MVQRGLVVIEGAEDIAGLASGEDALGGIHIREVDADAHRGAGKDLIVDVFLQFELVFAQGILGCRKAIGTHAEPVAEEGYIRHGVAVGNGV